MRWPTEFCLSAPGKLMVAGEYVVLDGAPALVVAVDRRVRGVGSVEAGDRSGPLRSGSAFWRRLPPEAVLARQRAERSLGAAAMRLGLDTSALRVGARKIGLGSSAAAAAVAAAAVHLFHGRDLRRGGVRAEVLAHALEGHAAVAPEGSGADVMAAVLGGMVRVEGGAPRAARWPAELPVRCVWTGLPARTSALVGAVRRLADESPPRYEEVAGPLRAAAARLVGAVERADAAGAASAARAHGAAMERLGEAAGVPIVTPALRAAAALAEEVGGGAKPSGAGGGDVALAFFPTEDAARRFELACARTELVPLPLGFGADGVREDGG